MKLSKPKSIKDTSNDLSTSVKSNSESFVLCTEDSLTFKSFADSQIEIKENFQENPKIKSKKIKWTSKALPTLGE
jgi:hypothetical protein